MGARHGRPGPAVACSRSVAPDEVSIAESHSASEVDLTHGYCVDFRLEAVGGSRETVSGFAKELACRAKVRRSLAFSLDAMHRILVHWRRWRRISSPRRSA